MPIHHLENKLMVLPDFSYKEKYWSILSSYVSKAYGNDEISEPNKVQIILKECFKLLEDSFMEIIKNQNKASFYLYVHNFHENSIELWQKQLEGIKLSINEHDFAITRRVLKIVLEQSCGIDLVGTQNFGDEMYQNEFEYLKSLEELLYVGYWAIGISEYIAQSQLFPKSVGIVIKEKELNILVYAPYTLLLDFIHKDVPRHNSGVVLHDTMIEFNKLMMANWGMDYHKVSEITNQQISNPKYKLGVIKIEDIIQYLIVTEGYNKNTLIDYYSGLTLTRHNFMSFEDCILRNQDINRHTYRPILQMNIDNQIYCIIGRNKWIESLTVISTNALPFGVCSDEWKKYKEIRKFISSVSDNHDKVLEKPLLELLTKYSFKFANNIKSFRQIDGNNVSIDKKGVGEIDIIFLDEERKIIYICECKHNRSRFDMFNWKRDYSNFKETYENQLNNKTGWAETNKDIIAQHFSVTCGIDLDLSNYEIIGIFAINAPTIYNRHFPRLFQKIIFTICFSHQINNVPILLG